MTEYNSIHINPSKLIGIRKEHNAMKKSIERMNIKLRACCCQPVCKCTVYFSMHYDTLLWLHK